MWHHGTNVAPGSLAVAERGPAQAGKGFSYRQKAAGTGLGPRNMKIAASAFQMPQLVLYVSPFFRIGQGVFLFGDIGPLFREFRVQLKELELVFG